MIATLFNKHRLETSPEVLREQFKAARIPDTFWAHASEEFIPKDVAKFLLEKFDDDYFVNDDCRSLLFSMDPIPSNVLPAVARVFVNCGFKTQYVRAMRLIEAIKSKEATYGYNLDLERAWDASILIIDCGFEYDFLNCLERQDRIVYHEFMVDYVQEGGCIISATNAGNFDDVYSPLQYLVETHFFQVD